MDIWIYGVCKEEKRTQLHFPDKPVSRITSLFRGLRVKWFTKQACRGNVVMSIFPLKIFIYIYLYLYTKPMKNESLLLLCFCAMRFTAVAALQAQQSVVIDLLRHWSNCNYNNNGYCNSKCMQAISVISSHKEWVYISK